MTSQTAPLAMQVVAHDVPERSAEQLAAAVASAVASFLHAFPDEFLPAMNAWARTGSRKVVRHARGSRWDRAAEGAVGFHTADVFDGIAVQVFSPAPIDSLPPGVRRCQVSGHKVDPVAAGTPDGLYAIHVVLNQELEMSPGKGGRGCCARRPSCPVPPCPGGGRVVGARRLLGARDHRPAPRGVRGRHR